MLWVPKKNFYKKKCQYLYWNRADHYWLTIPGLSTLSTTDSSEPVLPKAGESRPLLLLRVVVYVQKLCEGKSAPAGGSPSPARAPTRLNYN